MRLEIFPDGSSEESEGPATAGRGSRGGSYSYQQRTSANGMTATVMHFDGTGPVVEPLLLSMGVPSLLASLIAAMLGLVCSAPGCLIMCAWCGGAFKKRKRKAADVW